MRWHVVIDARLESQGAFELLVEFLTKLVNFGLSIFVVRKQPIHYIIDSVFFCELSRFRVNHRFKSTGWLFLSYHLLVLFLLLNYFILP